METKTEKLDTLNLFKKRMELLVGAKLKETNKTKEAMKVQDRIRAKIGDWKGSEEIKKWRKER